MEKRNELKRPNHSYRFIFGYAMGEFGFTFFLFFVAYYLMVYMTDVLRLPTALAATLYTAVQWVEAITMVLSGLWIDRVNLKLGKYRPWVLFGSIITAVGMLLFYTAIEMPIWGKAVWFTLFYLVAYIGYNLMWVGYRTLLGPVSRNPQDTISLTSTAAQMGSVAGLCFSFIGVRMLNGFSTPELGYSMSALLYGSMIVLCMLIVFKITRPYDSGNLTSEGSKQKPLTFKQIIGVFTKPMVSFFLAVTFREAASTILATLMVFYFGYNMGNPGLMSVYLSVVTFSGIIGHFIARKIANIFGKKKMFVVASFMSCVCIISTRFVGTSVPGFMILMGLNSFFGIFSGAMIPAFITEIADYNEYAKGVYARAFTSSLGGTALRFSQIVGGGVAAFGLTAIGYSAGAEMNATITSGIMNLMTFGSAAVIIFAVACMLFYKIDRQTMELVYAERNAALKNAETL